MKRFFLSLFIVFFTTTFACLIGCSNKDNERKVDYQLQKQCGEDSERFFKKQYKEFGNSFNGFYQNHYNKKLNKCFIIVNHNDSPPFKTLFDVNESKIYGMISSGGDSCFVLDKKCQNKSEQEWDSLVKPYMEE